MSIAEINQSFEMQVEFLRSRGAAAQPHSLSSLIQHLIGTRELLLYWGASPALCTAGLFHSVYGTESFQAATVDLKERDTIREIIGAESEEIAYLFSVMTRESFEANLEFESNFRLQERTSKTWVGISFRMFQQLCNLNAANWLEQRERLPRSFRELGRERYRRMLKFVLPAAAVALKAAYEFPDDIW